MLTIRVFLSSPDDVTEERRSVVETLRALEESPLLRDRVNLIVLAWDDPAAATPFDARETPQASVNRWSGRPADCDLTIVILWSRLGTPLPPDLRRPDGSRFESGTVWELEDAISANCPVFIYRRTDPPRIDLDDPAFDDKRAQFAAVRSWFDSLRDNDGSLRTGVNEYKGPEQFQPMLRAHLEAYINQRLAMAGEPQAPTGGQRARAFADQTAIPLRAHSPTSPPSDPQVYPGTSTGGYRPPSTASGSRARRRLWLVGSGALAVTALLGLGLWRADDGATPSTKETGGPRPTTTDLNSLAPKSPSGSADTAAAAPVAGPERTPKPAALPTVQLSTPAEIRFESMRPSTYTLMSLTPEAGTRSHWRLRAKMRLAAGNNSGSMHFTDSDFRLLVDGVPRAPSSSVNLLVESGTSKDADLLFNVPWLAEQLVLTVWHYKEQGQWEIELKGTQTPVPVTLPAGPRQVALDGPAEAVFTQATQRTKYTVLAIGTESRRPGVFGLRLQVRMHVMEGSADSFGNDKFRLLVDGVAQAPDSWLNDLVGGRSAKDADIAFEVPDGASKLVFRIVHSRDQSAELPLKLAPRQRE